MPALAPHKTDSGLRALAIFEASKGALVLAVGVGLLSLVHHNVQSLAQELIRHLHLNPAKHYPRILLDAASSVTDSRLWMLATAACLYSVARFVEGYGLWYGRRWAEWLGVASGAIYLPAEVYELRQGVTPLTIALIGLNAAIVAYLARELWVARKHREKRI